MRRGGTYSYAYDNIGNRTTAFFGIQTGHRALYEYGPYVNILRMEGNAAENNPFRFSSEYADDELGLIYYNYRYFHSTQGYLVQGNDYVETQYTILSDFALYSGCLFGAVLSYSRINLADQLMLSGKRHAGVVVKYIPSFLARVPAS